MRKSPVSEPMYCRSTNYSATSERADAFCLPEDMAKMLANAHKSPK